MAKLKFGKGGLTAELKMPETTPEVPTQASAPEPFNLSELVQMAQEAMTAPVPAEVDLNPLHERLGALEARLGKAEDHHGMATEYISRLESKIDQKLVNIDQKPANTIVHHKDHNAEISELQRTVKKYKSELERMKSDNRVTNALIFLAVGISIALRFI